MISLRMRQQHHKPGDDVTDDGLDTHRQCGFIGKHVTIYVIRWQFLVLFLDIKKSNRKFHPEQETHTGFASPARVGSLKPDNRFTRGYNSDRISSNDENTPNSTNSDPISRTSIVKRFFWTYGNTKDEYAR